MMEEDFTPVTGGRLHDKYVRQDLPKVSFNSGATAMEKHLTRLFVLHGFPVINLADMTEAEQQKLLFGLNDQLGIKPTR